MRGVESLPSSSPCLSSSPSPCMLPPHLLVCPLLCISSYASPLVSSFTLAVVDRARMPTWHGCLFVEGGQCCVRVEEWREREEGHLKDT